MTFYNQELRNIGKIITLGSLNLSLTLRLEEYELKSFHINIRKIKSLKDLSFIIENEQIWEKIELSTSSELINTLIHMNRIKRIKNIVAYLVYDKIEFTEEQIKFQRLLDCILLKYGIVIYSYNICKCKNNISFNLIYKNYSKKIMLYGYEYDNTDFDTIGIINNNKKINETNEEKKEEIEQDSDNDENIGVFDKIPEDQVNFDDFKYIYIRYRDFIFSGEFHNVIKLKEIYNFMRYIKKNFKMKIILNFGEKFKFNEKYIIKLLKIVDIHIFGSKNELLDILIKRKEKDILIRQKNKEKKLLEMFNETKNSIFNKTNTFMKWNENKNSSFSFRNINKINRTLDHKYASSYNKQKQLENRAKNIKSLIIAKTINLPTNLKNQIFFKNNIYNYIHELIYTSSEKNTISSQDEKLGIYLDDIKNITIVNYKELKINPDINEYDFHIYPKSSVFSLKEIENIKSILKSNYALFSYIKDGCILRVILDNLKNGKENYYLFYFYIRICLLKILSLIKKGVEIPTKKEFYIIELKKNELNRIITEENTKKKENGFNINNSFRDYLNKEKESFCSSPKVDGKYITIYKQKFLNNTSLLAKHKMNGYKTQNKFFMKSVKGNKISKINNLRKTFWNNRRNKKSPVHVNGIFELSVYLTKEDKKRYLYKLPFLKMDSKSQMLKSFRNSKMSKIELKDSKDKDNNLSYELVKVKVDTSKYKEIKFQPTNKG